MRSTTEIFLKVGNLVQVTVARTKNPREKLTAEVSPDEVIKFLNSSNKKRSLVGTRIMILEKQAEGIVFEIVEGMLRIKSDPMPEAMFRNHILNCPNAEKMLDLYRE